MNVEKMLKAKDKSVTGLTKGIEGLFKKNKVAYVKGKGKFTGANEVTVELIKGGEEKVAESFFFQKEFTLFDTFLNLYYVSSYDKNRLKLTI